MRNITTIVEHYLIAALWTNELEGCEIDNKPTGDATLNTVECARLQVECFLGATLPLLAEEWTDEQIGHDLWLTRGGHGTGFWDRGLPNGDKLAKICKMISFNGEVYEENGVAYINNDETPLNLFENYEMLPQNVQDVLLETGELDNTYEACDKLLAELKPLGFQFDYYLDAMPFNLRIL